MSDQWIVVNRWDGKDGFQHYKDRDPIWIKNYTRLLADDAYLNLTLSQRGLLHGIWLEYARSGQKLTTRRARQLLSANKADSRHFQANLEAVAATDLITLRSTYEAPTKHLPLHEQDTNETPTRHQPPAQPSHAGDIPASNLEADGYHGASPEKTKRNTRPLVVQYVNTDKPVKEPEKVVSDGNGRLPDAEWMKSWRPGDPVPEDDSGLVGGAPRRLALEAAARAGVTSARTELIRMDAEELAKGDQA